MDDKTDLKLTSISGPGITFSGEPVSNYIGKYISELFCPDPVDIVLQSHKSALEGVSQTFEFEWQERVFHSTVEALRNSSDKITGVIGAAFDITKRIDAEIILKKSEQFNASLLNNSPNPISVINNDTSIAYVNPAFVKLTGFNAQKIIGLKAPYPWWIEKNEKALESFIADLRKNKSIKEMVFFKKNRELFNVKVTTNLIANDESKYYLQTWVDITEAKRLKNNLEFYVMQVTRAQEEERKRIARELHEETVQSLATLCMATEAIIKSGKHDPQNMLKDLNQIRDSINGVIQDVRRFSYDLRPGVLDYLGLSAALETLTDDLIKKELKLV
jgi:PAS domain S-box-containing protein